MIHLTFTGYYAGVRYCQSSRDDNEQNVHGIYAPLNKPDYRAQCCTDCLKLWDESIDDNLND
jgi:hypothetical protein